MRETDSMSLTDKIIGSRNDRHRCSPGSKRPDCDIADGDDRIEVETNEIGCQTWDAFDMTFGVAPLNENVATLHNPDVTERLRHSIAGISGGIGFEYAHFRQLGCRLLRTRRERPCSRHAANERDELAPFHHSITSSARPSNLSGTWMPSALAVFRLMTRLNFVGCCTGKS